MAAVDPFAVLGLDPASSPQEAAAAYRRLAKEWHPDRAGVDAARRMAEINAAYDLLRAGDWQRRREAAHGRPRRHQGRPHAHAPHAAGRRGRGCRPRSGRPWAASSCARWSPTRRSSW